MILKRYKLQVIIIAIVFIAGVLIIRGGSKPNLPNGYIELLKDKNKNIVEINEIKFSENFNLIKSILLGYESYYDNLVTNNYLN